MDAAHLQVEIEKVCPVVAVTVIIPDDRGTWDYVPTPEATPQEIAAADNVIATIPIAVPGKASNAEFLARWTNAEYLALEKKRRDDIANNKVGNAKNWDIVLADELIDMTRQKVQTLKADLVADGVLTQARADEIFG
ncbi:MAG TPA: hypothetical protein VH482_31990 [Thermomicrobiales bacterium]|jgi:hypothetical protein